MQKQSERSHIIYYTTTSSVSKIRGFTIDVLYCLKDRMLTSSDIAEITGKYGGYVRRYLYNMQRYGLVEKSGSFWKLTHQGLSLLLYLESLNKDSRIERKKSERKAKEERKKSESCIQNKPKQLSIQLFIKNSHRSLSDIEVEVVDILLDHYNKTGSKWIYAHAGLLGLAEHLRVDYDSLGRALLNLRQDGIIYTWPKLYERQTFKLGLKSAFLKKLEAAAKSSP